MKNGQEIGSLTSIRIDVRTTKYDFHRLSKPSTEDCILIPLTDPFELSKVRSSARAFSNLRQVKLSVRQGPGNNCRVYRIE